MEEGEGVVKMGEGENGKGGGLRKGQGKEGEG
jgi:hypothetical protein